MWFSSTNHQSLNDLFFWKNQIHRFHYQHGLFPFSSDCRCDLDVYSKDVIFFEKENPVLMEPPFNLSSYSSKAMLGKKMRCDEIFVDTYNRRDLGIIVDHIEPHVIGHFSKIHGTDVFFLLIGKPTFKSK